VHCRNLVTADPFCLRKVKKYDDRPQGFGVGGAALKVVMSMQRDHQVLEPESGALWPALWVGAAVVAMVAFSYWLNVM
jgi:hypothetical protein